MSLSDILGAFDITENEFGTYRILLQKGYSTVGYLARTLNKPRTSLYGFLYKLQQKGLINQSFRDGVKTFGAESPDKMDLLLNKKLDNVRRAKQSYIALKQELKKEILSSTTVPKIRLYEEKAVRALLLDMFLYSDIEIAAFWPIKNMLQVFSPSFLEYHNHDFRVKINTLIN